MTLEFDQVTIWDGGTDGDILTPDNSLLFVQGIMVPSGSSGGSAADRLDPIQPAPAQTRSRAAGLLYVSRVRTSCGVSASGPNGKGRLAASGMQVCVAVAKVSRCVPRRSRASPIGARYPRG